MNNNIAGCKVFIMAAVLIILCGCSTDPYKAEAGGEPRKISRFPNYGGCCDSGFLCPPPAGTEIDWGIYSDGKKRVSGDWSWLCEDRDDN